MRVQTRDPDALANVRIAYGPYARRCGVCAGTARGSRHACERSLRPQSSVSLCRLYLRSRSRESGARDTASGLGYTRFFFLRTTVLQHELFFSQYLYDVDDYLYCVLILCLTALAGVGCRLSRVPDSLMREHPTPPLDGSIASRLALQSHAAIRGEGCGTSSGRRVGHHSARRHLLCLIASTRLQCAPC